MRRILGLACVVAVATVASACKPDALTVAETYERDSCACARHDVACVRAAQSKFEDDNAKVVSHWYQRKGNGTELQHHVDAARECHHRVYACSPSDPCGAGRACVDMRPEDGLGHCVPVVGEGQVCGGWDGDACAEGMWCKRDEVTEIMNQPCEIPCPLPGKCVRGTPPPGGDNLLQQLGSHAPSPSASASP